MPSARTPQLSDVQHTILELILGEGNRRLGSSGSIRHKLRDHYSRELVDQGIDGLIERGLLKSCGQTNRSRKGNVSFWLAVVDQEDLLEFLDLEQRIPLAPKQRLRMSMLATGECLRTLIDHRTALGAASLI